MVRSYCKEYCLKLQTSVQTSMAITVLLPHHRDTLLPSLKKHGCAKWKCIRGSRECDCSLSCIWPVAWGWNKHISQFSYPRFWIHRKMGPNVCFPPTFFVCLFWSNLPFQPAGMSIHPHPAADSPLRESFPHGRRGMLKMEDEFIEKPFPNTLCLLSSISMRSWHCRWWSARVW